MAKTFYQSVLKKDSDGNVLQTTYGDLAFRGEYDGSNNLIYGAFARPGTAESDERWQLFKMTYSGTNLTSRIWPEASNNAASSEYIFSWTDRATYTYA